MCYNSKGSFALGAYVSIPLKSGCFASALVRYLFAPSVDSAERVPMQSSRYALAMVFDELLRLSLEEILFKRARSSVFE